MFFRQSPGCLPRLNKSWGRAAWGGRRRSSPGQPGAAQGSQEQPMQPGAATSSPGAARESPGAARSSPRLVRPLFPTSSVAPQPTPPKPHPAQSGRRRCLNRRGSSHRLKPHFNPVDPPQLLGSSHINKYIYIYIYIYKYNGLEGLRLRNLINTMVWKVGGLETL